MQRTPKLPDRCLRRTTLGSSTRKWPGSFPFSVRLSIYLVFLPLSPPHGQHCRACTSIRSYCCYYYYCYTLCPSVISIRKCPFQSLLTISSTIKITSVLKYRYNRKWERSTLENKASGTVKLIFYEHYTLYRMSCVHFVEWPPYFCTTRVARPVLHYHRVG